MEQINNQNTNMEMNMDTGVAKKQGKGMMFGMIACAVLAIGGIGFGIYEMSQVKTAKQQIADLKIEVKKDDGSTTTIETDQVEVKEADKTVIITDTANSFKNAVLTNDESTGVMLSFYPFARGGISFGGGDDLLEIRIKNGEVDMCDLYPNGNHNEAPEKCVMDGFGGKIVDVIYALVGNGMGDESIFFLMEDGSVEYIPVFKAAQEKNFSSRGKLPINGTAIRMQKIEVNNLQHGGGYIDTAIYLLDGSIVRYSSFKDQLDLH